MQLRVWVVDLDLSSDDRYRTFATRFETSLVLGDEQLDHHCIAVACKDHGDPVEHHIVVVATAVACTPFEACIDRCNTSGSGQIGVPYHNPDLFQSDLLSYDQNYQLQGKDQEGEQPVEQGNPEEQTRLRQLEGETAHDLGFHECPCLYHVCLHGL